MMHAGSNPLPLQQLAKQYPNMDIVMIHCWPFLKEAAFLAKLVPNIHVDTCWLPVLNPEFLREAFNTWLNYLYQGISEKESKKIVLIPYGFTKLRIVAFPVVK